MEQIGEGSDVPPDIAHASVTSAKHDNETYQTNSPENQSFQQFPPVPQPAQPPQQSETSEPDDNEPSEPVFRYKYAEAGQNGGCPAGVAPKDWNKIFTAADSRIYNKHGKNANQSRAKRATGETRELALAMLADKIAQAAGVPTPTTSNSPSIASRPKPYTPKTTASRASYTASYGKEEQSFSPENLFADGKAPLSVAEQIKLGRKRKATAVADGQGSQGAIAMDDSTPPQPKMAKPGPKKEKKTEEQRREKRRAKKRQSIYDHHVKMGYVFKPGYDCFGKKPPPDNAINPPVASPESYNATSGSDDGIYCICKKPDDHRLMLACEGGCDDWYHCSCMQINEEDVDEERNGLLDRFICPRCTVTGGPNPKVTTWRPMCRMNDFNGCRKAALVHGDVPSKYCSLDHGLDYWNEVMLGAARLDPTHAMGGRLNEIEVNSMIAYAPTFDQIQAMGQRPRLPVRVGIDVPQLGIEYLTSQDHDRIRFIKKRREDIWETAIATNHQQQQLAQMALARHKAVISNPEVDPMYRDVCGYDHRISFDVIQFNHWVESTEGVSAMSTGILGPRTLDTLWINQTCSENLVPNDPLHQTAIFTAPESMKGMCNLPRKKCARHVQWFKTCMNGLKAEEMRLISAAKGLLAEEESIIDDAELRAAASMFYADNMRTIDSLGASVTKYGYGREVQKARQASLQPAIDEAMRELIANRPAGVFEQQGAYRIV